MNTFKKEIPLLLIVAIPFIYLGYIWDSMPEKVPMHWNIEGKIDRWGNKSELFLLLFCLPVLTYGLFLLIPKIDPKGKIKEAGNKFYSLKFIVVSFMSLLAVYIIHSTKQKSLMDGEFVFIIVGALFMVLGNYFKTIKQNYFIGIRTPWTLENETVWKDTHVLGGKLWFVGGFLCIIASLVLKPEINLIVFLSITAVITIIPIAYSYFRFKQLKTL